MDKPQITKFERFAEMTISKYERYLPTAFDESLTLLEKMNKLIQYLNEMGLLVNDVVENWNKVMEWVMNDGLTQSVYDKLDQMLEDGVFDRMIGDMLFGKHNLKSWGSVNDRETDETALVQQALNDLPPYSILYIPVGTKWDYKKINHPEDIIIHDDSTYDFTNDDWTAQQKIITNASNPGSKNANEIIHVAPYHPAFVVDIMNDTGRTSFLHRRNGVGTFQEVVEKHNDDNLYSLKDLQPSNGTNVFQILGGVLANNEYGFNNVPSKGVAYSFRSKTDGNHVRRYFSKDETGGTLLQYYKGSTETHRIHFEPLTDDILISNRITGKHVKILKSGYIEEAIESIAGSPKGKSEIYKFGQMVFDHTTGTWYISTSKSGTNGWQPLQDRNREVIQGSPVGQIDIKYLGQEVYDSQNQTWYKSTSNSGNLGWVALNS